MAAMEVGRQILGAASRTEVERLSELLKDAERGCVGPLSRFVSATHAYADSLKWTSDADGGEARE
jgi:hypothetical protein